MPLSCTSTSINCYIMTSLHDIDCGSALIRTCNRETGFSPEGQPDRAILVLGY